MRKLTAIAFALCLAGPAASEVPDLATADADSLLVDKLSGEYGAPPADVASLRAKGLRWREVEFALAIARKAGRPPAEVAGLRDQGVPWEEIARRQGFTLDEALGVEAGSGGGVAVENENYPAADLRRAEDAAPEPWSDEQTP